MSVAQQPADLPRGIQFTRALAATTLTIPNRTGHRRTLEDYWVKDGASGYNDVKVGNSTLLRIYDNLAIAVMVAGPSKRFGQAGFFRFLADKIKDFPKFNAAQDESIVFTRDSTFDLALAHWSDQDSGDVTSRDKPGGSMARKHLFILNLNNGSAVGATGSYNIDNPDMPTGLSLFAGTTNRMAASNKFTLYAIAAYVPVATASKTTAIHIFDEQIELFTSETNQGLYVDPTVDSQLAFDMSLPTMFWLDEPYVFNPNRLLAFKADATYDGANPLTANSQKLFLIGIREQL